MGILSIITLMVAGGGLASAVVEFVRHLRAEQALVKAVKRYQAKDDTTRQLLVWARTQLASEPPDPTTIAAIAALLTEVSSRLSESDRKDILGTLTQGSDKSKANYLVKIINEVGSTEPQAS